MTSEAVTTYDSRPDTWEHINQVRTFIEACIGDLMFRARDHDQTKLEDPELAIFNEYTPKLAGSTYGSDEYKSFLAGMKPALDHHYAAYRHHPEHFENGVKDMNLIDVLEMLCDWKAATMRHADGDLGRSIEINAERFGYGEEFKTLLVNTARSMGWLAASRSETEGVSDG